METSTNNKADITRLIGEICVAWSELERNVWWLATLHITFKAPIDRSVVESKVDMQGRISIAKLLCFRHGPKKYQANLEMCLSFIENKIRPMRNRYIHDSYFFWEVALKIQLKPKIIKNGASQREIETTFPTSVHVKHMELTVDAIKAATSYVHLYFLRTMKIAGDHEVDATEAEYDSEFQNFKEVMELYLEATEK